MLTKKQVASGAIITALLLWLLIYFVGGGSASNATVNGITAGFAVAVMLAIISQFRGKTMTHD